MIVLYLFNYPNENNNLAFAMFDHLLLKVDDINKRNIYGIDVDYHINVIFDGQIKTRLREILKFHKLSKYLFIKDNMQSKGRKRKGFN